MLHLAKLHNFTGVLPYRNHQLVPTTIRYRLRI